MYFYRNDCSDFRPPSAGERGVPQQAKCDLASECNARLLRQCGKEPRRCGSLAGVPWLRPLIGRLDFLVSLRLSLRVCPASRKPLHFAPSPQPGNVPSAPTHLFFYFLPHLAFTATVLFQPIGALSPGAALSQLPLPPPVFSSTQPPSSPRHSTALRHVHHGLRDRAASV